MASSNAPAKFLVDPFELRKAGTVLLSTIAMIEATHASRAGRPISFVFGQILLAPIVGDIVKLATACGHTASNYESCEAGLTPQFLKDFEKVEPQLVRGTAAVASLMLGSLGAGETAVGIAQKGVTAAVPATTVPALLERLQNASHSQNILVEVATSESGAGRQFTLYLPGTQNWQLQPGTKAFDLTSDVAAMAGPGFAAPERAALTALREQGFGTQPGDKVLIAGYSEGGLVGANLIAGGAIASLGGAVSGLVAVGSPVSSAKIPPGIRVISLEHSNDPVPKLDLAERKTRGNWTTQKLPAAGLLGHSLASYQQSVDQLDAAEQANLEKTFTQMTPLAEQISGDQPKFGPWYAQVSAYQASRMTT